MGPLCGLHRSIYLCCGDKVTFNIAHLISQGRSSEDATQNILFFLHALDYLHRLQHFSILLGTALFLGSYLFMNHSLFSLYDLQLVTGSGTGKGRMEAGTAFLCARKQSRLSSPVRPQQSESPYFSGISFSRQISSRKADT